MCLFPSYHQMRHEVRLERVSLIVPVLVCVYVCVHCGKCEEKQVYLTGQVAPLCLKPYLHQPGLYGCKTGKEKWWSVRLKEETRNCLCKSQVSVCDG